MLYQNKAFSKDSWQIYNTDSYGVLVQWFEQNIDLEWLQICYASKLRWIDYVLLSFWFRSVITVYQRAEDSAHGEMKEEKKARFFFF